MSPRAVRRRVAVALAAALTAAALAPRAAGGADLPAYGGELRVALPQAPRLADPALARELPDQWLSRALHETPLRLGPAGALEPALLAAIPEPQAGGRTFRLTLREGLRFADGSPLLARDLAASLARLLRPEVGSPHAWVAVAVQGADEVLAGRAAALSGVQVLSERELQVALLFPFPGWPSALAALPAAVVSPAGAGAGPFRRDARDRLVANEQHWRGRPYADALTFSESDARAAARGLEAGALDLSLRTEASTVAGLPGPRTVVLAAVNGRRLGAGAPAVRRILGALDRVDLVRRFVRSSAGPLSALLPPPLLPPVQGPTPVPASAPTSPPPPAPGPAAGSAPSRLVLLVPAWSTDARAVAERLQVRLFDAGLRAALEPLEPAAFAARLAAGDYDLAVVAVPLQATTPALAAGQVAGAVWGAKAARRAEQALAPLAPETDPAALAAAAEVLRLELDLWPLFTTEARLTAGPTARGGAPSLDRAIDLGDWWRRGGTP